MSMRTTSKTVIFHYPFRLSGLESLQPAGSYQVETYEQQMEDVSFLAFRRVATLLHLHPTREKPSIIQTMAIDPGELELALALDSETERQESPPGAGPVRRDSSRP